MITLHYSTSFIKRPMLVAGWRGGCLTGSSLCPLICLLLLSAVSFTGLLRRIHSVFSAITQSPACLGQPRGSNSFRLLGQLLVPHVLPARLLPSVCPKRHGLPDTFPPRPGGIPLGLSLVGKHLPTTDSNQALQHWPPQQKLDVLIHPNLGKQILFYVT